MPQAAQLAESDVVSEQPELHIICPPGQVLPFVPALPAPLVPAVPGLGVVAGLMQAAAKIVRQRPIRDTRAVFCMVCMAYLYFPTKVVTDVPASAALKLPPLTGTAVFATRLSADDVT